MDLLFIFDHYHPYLGGAEVLNRKVAEHFAQRHNVSVITRKYDPSLKNEELVNSVKIYRTGGPRWMHSLTAFLKVLMKVRRWEVVLSATYSSALAGYWLGRIFRKKSYLLVYEILDHNWRQKGAGGFLYRAYEKFIVTRGFDHYIAISQFTKNAIAELGVPAEKITAIYCGVDNELFTPRPADPVIRKMMAGPARFVYLYFGRPGISKGIKYLIEAVPLVSEEIPDSRLVMILSPEPGGQYREVLKLIKKHNLQDQINIVYPVGRTELPDYVNTADAVVIPSLSEGFGFSAAEACALGKIVVASRAGSLPEVVSGKIIMVEPASSSAISQGVIGAYKRSYDSIAPKVFDWARCLQKYEDVICG